MIPLEDFYNDWIQCENYKVLTKLKVCDGVDTIHRTLMSLGLSIFMDQWLVHIMVLVFLASISVMLFASFADEQMCLREIRSKVGNNWFALLNLIYAVQLTQELTRRNKTLRLEAIKAHLISNHEKQEFVRNGYLSRKENSDFELVSQGSSSICLSPKISTISNLSPRTKKPKLDKDSGNESVSLTDSESRKICLESGECSQESFNFKKPLEIGYDPEFSRSADSDKLIAPPSTPVTSPSTPRSKEVDMNISSIKGGIFEKRKNFFEKTTFENIRPRQNGSGSSISSSDLSSNSKKSVVIVEGNGDIKYLYPTEIC